MKIQVSGLPINEEDARVPSVLHFPTLVSSNRIKMQFFREIDVKILKTDDKRKKTEVLTRVSEIRQVITNDFKLEWRRWRWVYVVGKMASSYRKHPAASRQQRGAGNNDTAWFSLSSSTLMPTVPNNSPGSSCICICSLAS